MKQYDKYAELKGLITDIYHKHKGRYGYRRITLELRNSGTVINHKTVYKLMTVLDIKSLVRVKKYNAYRKNNADSKAPNIMNRNFVALKPYSKWVTDTTVFRVCGDKVYLSPILDLFNGEIKSYNISKAPVYKQVTDMLDRAFALISDNSGLLLHSDQGWQYRLKDYRNRLKNKGVVQSMSRKGNCYDNAAMESFFGTLKSEFFHLQKFDSVEQFITELEEYIDYYNNDRIKSKLGGLSPVQYRTQYTPME